jgi:hypothetical protein
MKKIAITLFLLAMGIFLAAATATAATTDDIRPGPETPLIGNGIAGNGSILDQLYGLNNLQRVDDFGVVPNDQVWFNPGSVSATAQAKYAAFTQDFGYIPEGGSFMSLFTVAGNGINLAGPSATLNSGNVNFLWALDPSASTMWTSQPSQNDDGIDHMVTWLITDGNSKGNYVIAWEDLRNGGDRDFNDLVVEVNVTPVPIPAAILLLGSGLIGLAGIRKKFKR